MKLRPARCGSLANRPVGGDGGASPDGGTWRGVVTEAATALAGSAAAAEGAASAGKGTSTEAGKDDVVEEFKVPGSFGKCASSLLPMRATR